MFLLLITYKPDLFLNRFEGVVGKLDWRKCSLGFNSNAGLWDMVENMKPSVKTGL